MRTTSFHGHALNLPAGRLGRTQRYALEHIYEEGQDSTDRALHLHGRAARYASRYATALANIVDANPHLFAGGPFGPRGGRGYKWIWHGPIQAPRCTAHEDCRACVDVALACDQEATRHNPNKR
jgi:hypothetical protein